MEKLLKVGAKATRPKGIKRRIDFHPKIDVSGKWLQELGFAIGDFIKVVATDNYIQIAKAQTEEIKKEASHV